jgi:hypothetical protein
MFGVVEHHERPPTFERTPEHVRRRLVVDS